MLLFSFVSKIGRLLFKNIGAQKAFFRHLSQSQLLKALDLLPAYSGQKRHGSGGERTDARKNPRPELHNEPKTGHTRKKKPEALGVAALRFRAYFLTSAPDYVLMRR